jgi:hypothetical protein
LEHNKFMQANEMQGYRSLKSRMRREQLFWVNGIKKERLAILAVIVAIGAVGSIVYTVFNLIF